MRRRLTQVDIAAEDQEQLDRQRRYRVAADRMTEHLAQQPGVEKVALIGSVARPLWREVPPYYRRSGIAVAHRCKDLDLAVWASRLDGLNALRHERIKVTQALPTDRGGVPVQEIEMFLFEPGTDRYLGRVCYFGKCVAGKADCAVPGCGTHPFLKQHEGFALWPETLDPSRMMLLFDRAGGGLIGRASALPSVIEEASRMIEVTVTIPEHRRGELAELVERWRPDD